MEEKVIGVNSRSFAVDSLYFKEDSASYNVDSDLPKITLERALKIVIQRVGKKSIRWIHLTHELPPNLYLIDSNRETLQQSWKFLIGVGNVGILKSSHLICVCDAMGKILFDGSSNDEG